ncbi:hypothetical protein Sjap_014280 [Stephania japonica]|uniref:Uncharacterized protein n=1 Tax=Stephania japonica TaxID=461633 RepID=A0AAP0IZL6_9MAGN
MFSFSWDRLEARRHELRYEKPCFQRCSTKDAVNTPTHGITHVRLGQCLRGTRHEDAVTTNEVMASLTYVLSIRLNIYAMKTPSKSLDPMTFRWRVTVHRIYDGALIWVYGYLIVTSVRAGRLCSRPELEFDRLVILVFDGAELQSSKGKAPELRNLLCGH